jgi:hypothetical protein
MRRGVDRVLLKVLLEVLHVLEADRKVILLVSGVRRMVVVVGVLLLLVLGPLLLSKGGVVSVGDHHWRVQEGGHGHVWRPAGYVDGVRLHVVYLLIAHWCELGRRKLEGAEGVAMR